MSIQHDASTSVDRRSLGWKWIDRRVRQRSDARLFLQRHDIRSVYRLLGMYGVSQRKIAAITGQSQSKVSEIIDGRRVSSYPVLVRIAEGLDVPRGWMGLAYDLEAELSEPDVETGSLCGHCGHPVEPGDTPKPQQLWR